MIGQRLLHYQVVEKLGEGGMGVVYKARDTHLDRFVAIKVLPPEKVSDPDRKARFIREAKAASALNHPNIITIHDIASDNGTDFIAMEYVAGKTLDQLIPRKGMRLNEALKIAIQIADALARAHSAGIIHRDIKPANIMVDAHGQVKVLDFGLAKLTEQGDTAEASTATAAVKTEEGTIAGTAAYMSPEQAEGKPLDARSDIFSFGAVLYEMLAGGRAFQGDSKMSTMMAVLQKEPPPLGQDVPSDLRKVIARCLRKDSGRRFHHMEDMLVALIEVREESESNQHVAVPVETHRLGRPAVFSVLGITLMVAAAVVWYMRSNKPEPPMRTTAVTAYLGEERYPSLSPDGNQVAFSWQGEAPGNWDVYVQVAGPGRPLRLTTDPAVDRTPAWSPDGTQIAFVRIIDDQRAAIFVVPPLGGAERRISEFRPPAALGNFFGPSVSCTPDGEWLVASEISPDGSDSIVLLPARQGEKHIVLASAGPAAHYTWPVISPDGSSIAYVTRHGERSADLLIQPLGPGYRANGAPRRFTLNAWVEGVAWTQDSRFVIYSQIKEIFSGPRLWRISADGGGDPASLDIAGEGAMYPTVSRVGQKLAYVLRSADFDIMRFIDGGPPEPFLSSTRADFDPRFSPDGRRIIFASNRSGSGPEIWIANSDGSNLARLVEATGRTQGGGCWSPDGKYFVYGHQNELGRWDLNLIETDGGQPRRLVTHPADENVPCYSRDGRWLYFGSNRTGRYEVFRMPSAGGDAIQVTADGGFEAHESWDGKTLYYTKSHQGPLYSRAIAGGQETMILPSVKLESFNPRDKGIYYVPTADPGTDFIELHSLELRFFDFAARRSRTLRKFPARGGQFLSVSPDLRTILYSVVPVINADILLVENFR